MSREDKPNYYVSNKDLYTALVEYKKQYNEALEKGWEKPIPSNYIAECIIKINQRLAMSYKFANYPFIEEMISDGIENSIQYLYNYDPDKHNTDPSKPTHPNPFAYLTTISYYAFLRRIQKEKKYLYTKLSLAQHQLVLAEAISRNDEDGPNLIAQLTDKANEFIEDYEKTAKKKKTK